MVDLLVDGFGCTATLSSPPISNRLDSTVMTLSRVVLNATTAYEAACNVKNNTVMQGTQSDLLYYRIFTSENAIRLLSMRHRVAHTNSAQIARVNRPVFLTLSRRRAFNLLNSCCASTRLACFVANPFTHGWLRDCAAVSRFFGFNTSRCEMRSFE